MIFCQNCSYSRLTVVSLTGVGSSYIPKQPAILLSLLYCSSWHLKLNRDSITLFIRPICHVVCYIMPKFDIAQCTGDTYLNSKNELINLFIFEKIAKELWMPKNLVI
jgi:hypothetical protein